MFNIAFYTVNECITSTNNYLKPGESLECFTTNREIFINMYK